ncbi:MAG: ribosomal-processing cysteine protease Prp [Vulcanimicrobiaceae bacterium]
MVELHVREDGRQRLSSFFATGHAGWAESGEDVVCAAVSAILQAAWLGLAEIARVDVVASREDGRLEVTWPENVRADAGVRAIVGTAALSVERIALQYPDHVRVIRERDDG